MMLRPALHDSAFNLGAARVIVFAALWFSLECWAGHVVSVASLPREVLDPPRIMKALVRWLPPSGDLAMAGVWCLRVVCVLGLIGAWSRTMSLLACVLCTYLFGLLWCAGATSHKLHHFPALLAILAASPCGRALSVDARRRPGGPGGRGPAFGAPLRCMGVYFGLAYFFPGLWKLTVDAQGWLDGECLRTALWRAWLLRGEPFRIDQWPGAMAVLGTLTLVFELLFLPLVFWRRARPILVAWGIFFHVGVYVLMGIDFLAMGACLLVLIDWESVRARRAPAVRAMTESVPAPARRAGLLPLLGVCAVEWVCMTFTGVRDEARTWPISAYPSFRWAREGNHATTMAVVVREDGREEPLDDDAMQRIFGSHWDKTRQELKTDWLPRPRSDARRVAFLRFWAQSQGIDAQRSTLRLYTVVYSTDPEDRGGPPVSITLLCESAPSVSPSPAQ